MSRPIHYSVMTFASAEDESDVYQTCVCKSTDRLELLVAAKKWFKATHGSAVGVKHTFVHDEDLDILFIELRTSRDHYMVKCEPAEVI